MFILNYNNPQWSRDINCKLLNDCSGRTITDNGSKGIALLSNNTFTKKMRVDLFHIGVDVTLLMGVTALFNSKYNKQVKLGVALLATLYCIGRMNQKSSL